ncbi:putative C6 transcription factor [Phaeosphaeriaceae sp. PMI808]|nr:putative C6 transcription factor [Phaeosphaeriaceae sp. PMI808]
MSHNILAPLVTPGQSPEDAPLFAHEQTTPKPQRVLACVLCQQRKVKCDRKFPCANCIKAGVQCILAAQNPRQRRRRFPERDLLNRLRQYEDLLRQNHITFEPLHSTSKSDKSSPKADGSVGVSVERASIETRDNVDDDKHDETGIEDGDDSDSSDFLLREKVVKKVWDVLYLDSSDHLLLCTRNTDLDLSTLHPTQIHIFKLWQIYLDNFNPLLKVTHTPTLQARIIEAAGDVTNIDPPLEALMFSIYCVAVFTMDKGECQKLFGSSRGEVLANYQLGAREALINCGFLRSGNREVLVALHFYLMSVKPATDPRSLSSILGTTIRIAQRMGIHDESLNSRQPALEAELRRRLWWSIVMFDARLAEMTEFRLGMLLPTWDCKMPSNTNDFDFRPEMKTPPEVHGMTSEALFAVVRSEFGNFIRNSSFHLDFINPALKALARPVSSESNYETEDELDTLDRVIEKYLRYCDAQNPLHFLTIWWARGQSAKNRFIKLLSEATVNRTEVQRDATISYALTMLECDTKLMASKDLHGFRWVIYLNFPFPALVHVIEDLKSHPFSGHAQKAWNILSENSLARFKDMDSRDVHMDRSGSSPFFKIFSGVLLRAWSAHEAAAAQIGCSPMEPPPLIVGQIKSVMSRSNPQEDNARSLQLDPFVNLDNMDSSIPTDMNIGLPYGMGDDVFNISDGGFQLFPQQMPMGPDTYNWGWPI